MNIEKFTGVARDEVTRGVIDKELLAEANKASRGNRDLTKNLYVKLRAEQLARQSREDARRAFDEHRRNPARKKGDTGAGGSKTTYYVVIGIVALAIAAAAWFLLRS